jgi:hypothetical protein
MRSKPVKEIDGISVSGYSFGIKKTILKEIAKASELQNFIGLIQKKERLWAEARKEVQNDPRRYARPSWQQLSPINSELRGLRKYWRSTYTDSFSSGLYVATSKVTWEVGKCVGEFGTAWSNRAIEKGDVFMYVQHDRLGNVELVNNKTAEVIKIVRGSSVCDKFLRLKKGEENE